MLTRMGGPTDASSTIGKYRSSYILNSTYDLRKDFMFGFRYRTWMQLPYLSLRLGRTRRTVHRRHLIDLRVATTNKNVLALKNRVARMATTDRHLRYWVSRPKLQKRKLRLRTIVSRKYVTQMKLQHFRHNFATYQHAAKKNSRLPRSSFDTKN